MNRSSSKRKSKLLRLLRPLAWVTFFFPFSAGFALGVTPRSILVHVIFAFIAFCCWMSFCFISNAIADKDVDKYHDGRSKDINIAYQPLVTGEITEKKAVYLVIIFLFSSLLSAWLVNPFFFLMIFIVDILGYIYSMPPLRLKAKPVVDILCNTVAGAVIFIAGFSIGGLSIDLWMVLGVFVTISITASVFYIPTVVTDYEFDAKAGLMTSAVFFGPKKMLQVMYLLTVIVIVIWFMIFFSFRFELIKAMALFFITYCSACTLISNRRLEGQRLYLHQSWILVPFFLISVAFVIYGILKFMGL